MRSQAATSWWSALLPLNCLCGLCLGVWGVLSVVMVCVLLCPLVLHFAHSVIVIAQDPGAAGFFFLGIVGLRREPKF